jgi:hypothetical protein
MLLEDTDVYVDAQGYPLFTMSSLRYALRRHAAATSMARRGMDCSFAWMERAADRHAR